MAEFGIISNEYINKVRFLNGKENYYFMAKKIVYNPDEDDLSLEIVEYFFSAIRSVEKEKIYIALSGGNSLKSFYSNLIYLSEFLDQRYWDKVIFCLVDERIVPTDDKNSNQKTLMDEVLEPLLEKKTINKNQIIFPDPSSEEKALEYNSKIPQIDICLLGAGEDSHTASLFPKHDSIKNESEKFIIVENSPKSPPTRLSMSKNMIAKSKFVFIFFIGESKRNAYLKFKNKNIGVEECPSKIVDLCQNSYVATNISTMKELIRYKNTKNYISNEDENLS